MTIPADVLKMLNIDVGATLEIEVSNGAFIARPHTLRESAIHWASSCEA